jgi:hypothetical protein
MGYRVSRKRTFSVFENSAPKSDAWYPPSRGFGSTCRLKFPVFRKLRTDRRTPSTFWGMPQLLPRSATLEFSNTFGPLHTMDQALSSFVPRQLHLLSRSFSSTLCHPEHKTNYFIPLMFDRTGFPSHNSGNATGKQSAVSTQHSVRATVWCCFERHPAQQGCKKQMAIGQVKSERPSPQRTPRSTEENGGKPFATEENLFLPQICTDERRF